MKSQMNFFRRGDECRAGVAARPVNPRRLGWWLVLSGFVALVCLTTMLLTESRLAISWDEGYSLGREARVRTWLRRWPTRRRSPGAGSRLRGAGAAQSLPGPAARRAGHAGRTPFSPVVLDWFWPFAREEPDGHPPVYAWVGLVGDLVARAGSRSRGRGWTDAGLQPRLRSALRLHRPAMGIGRAPRRRGRGSFSRTCSPWPTTRLTTACSRACGPDASSPSPGRSSRGRIGPHGILAGDG